MKFNLKEAFALKFKSVVLALLACALFAGAAMADAPFHIGIMTGTVSQSEDDLRGAELMIQKYGDSSKGGMITHITYPDNFMSEMETTITQLSGLADDPLMKVIVVNQGIPGTTEGFRRVREKRPDILLFAGEAHEDPGVITSAADLSINADNISRGYTIPLGAKKMGADTFVHISFPRHMSYETMSRRVAVMQETCKDLGMEFVLETAPDPTSDVGVSGAQQYILEHAPEWIEKYGQNSAYFCTNDAHTEPLLKQLLTYGGYFIEADLPSPLMGYPGALGIDLTEAGGDFEKILAAVEAAVVEQGGAGRFGTWAFSYGYTVSAGLAQHAYNVITGVSELDEIDDISEAYAVFSPGANWNGSSYTNAETGVKSENIFLVYQDTYIMGDPGHYMGSTEIEVPEKYFTVK